MGGRDVDDGESAELARDLRAATRGDDGTLYLVYHREPLEDETDFPLYLATVDAGGTASEFIRTGGFVNAQVAVNSAGRVHVVFGDSFASHIARQSDTGWEISQLPLVIGSREVPHLVIDDDSKLHIAFTSFGQLVYGYQTSAVGEPLAWDFIKAPPSDRVLDQSLALDAEGHAHFAYVVRSNGNDDSVLYGIVSRALRCSEGNHNGGEGTCVSVGTCTPGFHDDGFGVCVPLDECATGFFLDDDGTCAPL